MADESTRGDEQESRLAEAQAAMEESRRRLAEVPAELVVTNHAMGLYELAAIHLSASPPNLPAAALAIDAVACLVDGLGDRLGPDVATLRDALGNIRMAFVQVKAAAAGARASGSDPPEAVVDGDGDGDGDGDEPDTDPPG